MSKTELKKLIYDLENILKNDKRFKKNNDNNFKKIIKTMYINSKKQPVINVNRVTTPTPIIDKTECPKPKIKIIKGKCNCKPCATSVKTKKNQSYDNCYKLFKEPLEEIHSGLKKLASE